MPFLSFLTFALLVAPGPGTAEPKLNYEAMAQVAIDALELSPGERVLLRFDPGHFEPLTPLVRERIRQAGAIDVASLEYTPLPADGASKEEERAFKRLLEAADVYIWLPVRETVRTTSPAERRALAA